MKTFTKELVMIIMMCDVQSSLKIIKYPCVLCPAPAITADNLHRSRIKTDPQTPNLINDPTWPGRGRRGACGRAFACGCGSGGRRATGLTKAGGGHPRRGRGQLVGSELIRAGQLLGAVGEPERVERPRLGEWRLGLERDVVGALVVALVGLALAHCGAARRAPP